MSASFIESPRLVDMELADTATSIARISRIITDTDEVAMAALYGSQDLSTELGWTGTSKTLAEEPATAAQYGLCYRVRDVSPPPGVLKDGAYSRMILVGARPDAATPLDPMHRLTYEYRPDVRAADRVRGTIRIPSWTARTCIRIEESGGGSATDTISAMQDMISIRPPHSCRYVTNALWVLFESLKNLPRPERVPDGCTRFDTCSERQATALVDYLAHIVQCPEPQ